MMITGNRQVPNGATDRCAVGFHSLIQVGSGIDQDPFFPPNSRIPHLPHLSNLSFYDSALPPLTFFRSAPPHPSPTHLIPPPTLTKILIHPFIFTPTPPFQSGFLGFFFSSFPRIFELCPSQSLTVRMIQNQYFFSV